MDTTTLLISSAHPQLFSLHNNNTISKPPPPPQYNQITTIDTATESAWAPRLLRECARAISEKESAKIQQLLWMLNELSSPYGDAHQKLAWCFLQALLCCATSCGPARLRALTTAARKARSFDSARSLALKFQEATPWTTFGHVASNSALMEALHRDSALHVIDLGAAALCTQWPTLLEALATRSSDEDAPSLRLTVIIHPEQDHDGVTGEVGRRMEKFARLMGVPFEFAVASELTPEGVGIREGEAVAVSCAGALRRARSPEAVVAALRALNPKIVTVVEEEADFRDKQGRFEECLRFYGIYFEMLGESFCATSNERLMLERECARGLLRLLACDDDDDVDDTADCRNNSENDEWECERREKGAEWGQKMSTVFSPVLYSDDGIDDVRALLKRYPTGWGLVLPQSAGNVNGNGNGMYLTWKDEPVVWASAWKP